MSDTTHRPAITLHGVSVGLRARRRLFSSRHRVLQDLDLTIRHGETLGVIGRNGSGKTTLLRVIAGVLKPDSGTVARDPGATCQLLTLNPWLVPHLSGRQNALMACMLNGMTRPEAQALLPAIESFAELGTFFDEPASSYSAGMLVRLGFAAAIQADPDVLLLDELLGVGDAEFFEKSRVRLRELIDADRTVVLVSHNDAALIELCDRVIWLDGGKVRSSGDPREVLAAYRDHLHLGPATVAPADPP